MNEIVKSPIKTLMTPIKPRQTLGNDVYAQLCVLLTTGQLMPGETLSLRKIAEALDVSVMPVREAVNRLVAEQAFEVTPQRAIRVPILTVSEFQDITKIRILLEGMAVAEAAASRTPPELAAIELAQAKFKEEMEKENPKPAKLIEHNRNFHFGTYRAAHKDLLMQMIESLWLRIGPILNHDFRNETSRIKEKTAVNHHTGLLEALKKQDPKAAQEYLQRDIQSAAEFIISEGVLVSADH
jgi:DNA-binding GntR family transcriptional regulator